MHVHILRQADLLSKNVVNFLHVKQPFYRMNQLVLENESRTTVCLGF